MLVIWSLVPLPFLTGDRSIKSLVPYLVRALWPVVHVRRRPGTKESWLQPLGLVHQWTSWSLNTPSDQDVSCRAEEFYQGCHLWQERGPLPGAKIGLLSNTWKSIVWGDTRTDNARGFIRKGSLGGEQQGKGTQNCSATWPAVSDFMVIELVSGLSSGRK